MSRLFINDDSIHKRVNYFLEHFPVLNLDSIKTHSFSDPNKDDPIWQLDFGNTCQQNKEKKPFPFSENFIRTLLYVRNINKHAFNVIEGKENACTTKLWHAKDYGYKHELHGGGVMTVIRENTLEKSAVNMSVVCGPSYPATEGEYAGKPFAAAGVSLISHPKNPFAPIVHMNVRCIKVFEENGKTTTWIGGGADLTPMIPFAEDTSDFHAAMQQVCERNPQCTDYEKYKKWADDYFYIPHRKEMRGIGGIFFDFVKVNSDTDTNLLLDVGQFNAHIYASILARRADTLYDEDMIKKHQEWRARYAEFNLVYDRGTRFGLLSGGNYEAIFCSLPPIVRW